MAPRACTIPQCGAQRVARGLCGRHYARWRRHGDPEGGGQYRLDSPEEKFLRSTERKGDCLVWTGAVSSAGYGQVSAGGGRSMLAHRYAYEREHGPIPEGALIDHACHDKVCVEVAHLRLATHSENNWNHRGASKSNRLGVRNVSRARGGFEAVVRKDGVRHRKTFPTLEEAAAHAAALREELFGEYQGRG